MTRPKQSTEQIFERLEAGGRRSPVFRWFKANYARFLRASLTTSIDWDELASDLAASGITDSKGGIATPNTVKTTWHRVKRFMRTAPPAAVPSEPVPRVATPPSRFAIGWQPPLANEKFKTTTSPSGSVAPTPPTTGEGAPSSPRRTVADMTPQESMERALREMDRRANRRAGLRE